MPFSKRLRAGALRRLLGLLAMLAMHSVGAAEQALPSFAELEAAGATIGEIRVIAEDVFDLSNPKEDYVLFGWANKIHIQTRPGVIERSLLFKRGDQVSVRVLEETERLLRSYGYLYDVQFRPVALHDNVVDIEVMTRDSWSLEVGASLSRQGGVNSSGATLREHNLLGTGISVGLGRSNGIDRSSTEFEISDPHAFGTWISGAYNYSLNSDGRSDAVAVVRPFYALDTRWAAGVKASRDDRIESIYEAGNIESQYRHKQHLGEVFGGWSDGLVDGWVGRTSIGLSLQDDSYALEPGLAVPGFLPEDRKLAGPFVRYQLIEDRYERERNRNFIGRPEFFALGFNSTVQLGWAAPGLGSTDSALLYAGTLSRGFEPLSGHTLVASAKLSGQLIDGKVRHQLAGAQGQYYLPQSPRRLFYAGASGDMLSGADPNEWLMLGGDNGLRGYPLRYQRGTRRALFTLEQRFYTDIYLWQLFRIGGAAFYDVGRAWGGEGGGNPDNPGWLNDVGFGLRIFSARSASDRVFHVDVAVPLNATGDIKKVQFLVKSKASF